MELREIEKLLEKYFEGHTSLAEEKALRDWFKHSEVPAQLLPLKAQFGLFDTDAGGIMPPNEADNKLLEAIRVKQKQQTRQQRMIRLYSLSGIAAMLLLAAGLFFWFKPTTVEDSFNDPAMAWQEINKALFYVSGKMNMGIQPLEKAAASLNQGIEETARVSTMDQLQNIFKKD